MQKCSVPVSAFEILSIYHNESMNTYNVLSIFRMKSSLYQIKNVCRISNFHIIQSLLSSQQAVHFLTFVCFFTGWFILLKTLSFIIFLQKLQTAFLYPFYPLILCMKADFIINRTGPANKNVCLKRRDVYACGGTVGKIWYQLCPKTCVQQRIT